MLPCVPQRSAPVGIALALVSRRMLPQSRRMD